MFHRTECQDIIKYSKPIRLPGKSEYESKNVNEVAEKLLEIDEASRGFENDCIATIF